MNALINSSDEQANIVKTPTLNRSFIFLKKTAKDAYLALVKIYQIILSPVLGKNCKHYPSCSSYSLQAVESHGLLKGLILTTLRILRCNPWSLGGYDPIPEKVLFIKPMSFKPLGNYQTKLYKADENGQN